MMQMWCNLHEHTDGTSQIYPRRGGLNGDTHKLFRLWWRVLIIDYSYLSDSRAVIGSKGIRKKHCNETNKGDHVRPWLEKLQYFSKMGVYLRQPNW